MGGCSTLPSLVNRTNSTAIFNTGNTKLGRGILPLVESHPGKSGIYPLPDARDAFAARALLAHAAERALDLQYYIWHGDMSGTLLLNAFAMPPIAASAFGCCSTITAPPQSTRFSPRSILTQVLKFGCPILL